ncbi:MAG TPA: hypothetical protein DCY03_05150 [Planctomycetaceae bacterium]|nr:hypothetical protein [Planctomycetaceae bacterium]
MRSWGRIKFQLHIQAIIAQMVAKQYLMVRHTAVSKKLLMKDTPEIHLQLELNLKTSMRMLKE